jgi:hypothetical protein
MKWNPGKSGWIPDSLTPYVTFFICCVTYCAVLPKIFNSDARSARTGGRSLRSALPAGGVVCGTFRLPQEKILKSVNNDV